MVDGRLYTQINGRLDADRQTGSRRQTNRQASRGRQTDDIMEKAEGRQTRQSAGAEIMPVVYKETDWQVGGKRQRYRRQVVDRHPYVNRQTSGKRQLYKIKFDNL
jgi:hypothetical protein